MKHYVIFVYNDDGFVKSDIVDNTQEIKDIVTSGCAVEVQYCNELGLSALQNYQDQNIKTDVDGFASPMK
jgi:hypothetical protein